MIEALPFLLQFALDRRVRLGLDSTLGVRASVRHRVTVAVYDHGHGRPPGPLTPPGLGVDMDEAAAARFPYRLAYLPIARLEDGSMHNW